MFVCVNRVESTNSSLSLSLLAVSHIIVWWCERELEKYSLTGQTLTQVSITSISFSKYIPYVEKS